MTRPPYVPKDRSLLPKPGPLPREKNYTYAGHTSDLIPTPWPLEGRFLRPGDVRRFPRMEDRTPAIAAEIKRLHDIENPGRCASRRRWIDAWCRNVVTNGAILCYRHGGNREPNRAAARRRAEEAATKAAAERLLQRAAAYGTTPNTTEVLTTRRRITK